MKYAGAWFQRSPNNYSIKKLKTCSILFSAGLEHNVL